MSWFLNNLYNVVYNTTKLKLQYCKNGTYIDIPDIGGGSGTFVSVTAGAGLSGGTITTTGTISMPNIGAAGTYGNSTQYPIVTTDAQGRISNITLQTIPTTGISINGQIGSSQTFSNDVNGLTPNFVSASNIHTLNIPLASTVSVTSGTISNSDYQLFLNNWSLDGNIINSVNFLGSTNNQPLRFRTNNIERVIINSNGLVGIGLVPTIDNLEVIGSIRATSFVKANTGISVGNPALMTANAIQVVQPLTVTQGMSTTTDPLFGGRVQSVYTYFATTHGWRHGLNTGGIAGGYTPTMDYTIDELGFPSTGQFVNRLRIQKNTGFVAIGNTNFNTPTEVLDITGNLKLSGALMPNNLPGISGQILQSSGAGVAPTWITSPSGNINFIDNEIPVGTLNSINTVFILSNPPLTNSLHLYLRGLRLKNTVDYTISGLTITMMLIPDSGDSFLADYRY